MNGWAMQFLADICEVPVERPANQEATALGAAKLAALGAGQIADLAPQNGGQRTRWTPRMEEEERTRLLAGWRAAVRAALAGAKG
jgi:glycerol kinase